MNMVPSKENIRYASNPNDVMNYPTERLRKDFLIEDLFREEQASAYYSLYDRFIVIGIKPVKKPIRLDAYHDWTKSTYFLERRELGIINVGGDGTVVVDGVEHELGKKECLYVGLGKKDIVFSSQSTKDPAEFYLNSAPAHLEYPTSKSTLKDANRVDLGNARTSNERTIYQYIHEGGIQSCQLVMGFTELKTGNVWNTFPPHTHLRRMEVYFYFDLAPDQLVMHFMGEPMETRHLALKNKQAVISPEWSIHAGAGTESYAFVWGMAGENKAFTDMDAVDMAIIK